MPVDRAVSMSGPSGEAPASGTGVVEGAADVPWNSTAGGSDSFRQYGARVRGCKGTVAVSQ